MNNFKKERKRHGNKCKQEQEIVHNILHYRAKLNGIDRSNQLFYRCEDTQKQQNQFTDEVRYT